MSNSRARFAKCHTVDKNPFADEAPHPWSCNIRWYKRRRQVGNLFALISLRK